MKIAILRTEQADREHTYNKIEYAAAAHGACLVGYVDPRTRALPWSVRVHA